MKFLFAGIKNWPMHHLWEHAMAEALQAAGHDILFLGCAEGAFSSCECVDRSTIAAHGDHESFCKLCRRDQQGVHSRDGFRETALTAPMQLEQQLKAEIEGYSIAQLMERCVAGIPLAELLLPSLRRWGKSGEPVESFASPEILRQHALTVLRIEKLLPLLLKQERIDTVVVLNGIFCAERTISLVAQQMGLRVINYERGHVRNTLMISDGLPSCYMELGTQLPDNLDGELDQKSAALLDRYLEGRHSNRDSNARFGTAGQSPEKTRPRLCAFTNVSWDSSVCSRSTVFGDYRQWLVALLELAQANPELDVLIRIHPGEASLQYDPTLDRTGDWVRSQSPPENLILIDAEDPTASWELAQSADLNIVFCTTMGLELACNGQTVLTCGEVHYAGHGFTVDLQQAAEFESEIKRLLSEKLPEESTRRRARNYAYHLYFEAPMPFPWVEEVEYGHPQRLAPAMDTAYLAQDEHLRHFLAWLCGEKTGLPSLRMLLDEPDSCPLPWRFNSRLERPEGSLAVLIPACNRPQELRKVLQAYAEQSCGRRAFRVLVVDDGSTTSLDSTIAQFDNLLDIDCIRMSHNGGPARARNAGLDALLGNPAVGMVFITGDDMVPDPGLIAGLLTARRGWSDPRVALLAHVDWHPDLSTNRVMDLVTSNGMQFAFQGLPEKAILPPQYLYTSGVALEASFLRKHQLRFREDFPYAAWEDTEFATRAFGEGLILAYDKSLKLYHDHAMDSDSFCRRQQKAGAAARVFAAVNPPAFQQILGEPPQCPPDRQEMHALKTASLELAKLHLPALRGISSSAGELSEQLDREQNAILERLFQLNHSAGWFAEPVLTHKKVTPGLLSILIPVHNCWELTRNCLEAIARHTQGAHEIVVFDNGSTDCTAAELAKISGLQTLHSNENLGFACANNLAAEAANGEFLVLLNNDTIVQEGWDKVLRKELSDRVTGIVGLRLVYPDGSIQHAGVVFDSRGMPWHIYRGFPGLASQVMKRRELSAVTGACLGIRRDLYVNMKGLDENFRNCYEDIDLCLRVREAGYRIVYNPLGSVIHLEGKTPGRNDGVRQSWLVLQDRWAGRMPFDEARILSEDGLCIERGDTGLRYLELETPVTTQDKVRTLIDQGQLEEARKILRFQINQDPDNLQPRMALLDLEMNLGNLAAARSISQGFTLDAKRKQLLQDLDHCQKKSSTFLDSDQAG